MRRTVVAFVLLVVLHSQLAGSAGAQCIPSLLVNKHINRNRARTVSSPPASPVTAQVREGSFSPDAPALTQRHEMGWLFFLEGIAILNMEGTVTAPLEPVWIPEGTEYSLDFSASSATRFWFLGIGTNLGETVPPRLRLLGVTDHPSLAARQTWRCLPPSTWRTSQRWWFCGMEPCVWMAGRFGPAVHLLQPGTHVVGNVANQEGLALVLYFIPKPWGDPWTACS
jgi:hypothetical protein